MLGNWIPSEGNDSDFLRVSYGILDFVFVIECDRRRRWVGCRKREVRRGGGDV